MYLDDDDIAITGVYRIDGFFGQVKKLQHTLSSKILIKHRKEFNNYKVVIEAEVLETTPSVNQIRLKLSLDDFKQWLIDNNINFPELNEKEE